MCVRAQVPLAGVDVYLPDNCMKANEAPELGREPKHEHSSDCSDQHKGDVHGD